MSPKTTIVAKQTEEEDTANNKCE